MDEVAGLAPTESIVIFRDVVLVFRLGPVRYMPFHALLFRSRGAPVLLAPDGMEA